MPSVASKHVAFHNTIFKILRTLSSHWNLVIVINNTGTNRSMCWLMVMVLDSIFDGLMTPARRIKLSNLMIKKAIHLLAATTNSSRILLKYHFGARPPGVGSRGSPSTSNWARKWKCLKSRPHRNLFLTQINHSHEVAVLQRIPPTLFLNHLCPSREDGHTDNHRVAHLGA